MKKKFLFTVFILALVAFFGLAILAGREYLVSVQGVPEPLLVVASSFIDFGPDVAKTNLTTVTVTNRSRYPVNILDVAATCSCSQVMLEKGELSAGKSVKAEVSLSTIGREGKVTGKIGILYKSLDPKLKDDTYLANINLEAVAKPKAD